MLDDIVCCNELENDKYEKLVKAFDMFYTGFNLEGIAEDKMQILIRNEMISMNNENFTFLKENYPTCLAEFVQWNLKTYLELIEEGITQRLLACKQYYNTRYVCQTYS